MAYITYISRYIKIQVGVGRSARRFLIAGLEPNSPAGSCRAQGLPDGYGTHQLKTHGTHTFQSFFKTIHDEISNLEVKIETRSQVKTWHLMAAYQTIAESHADGEACAAFGGATSF